MTCVLRSRGQPANQQSLVLWTTAVCRKLFERDIAKHRTKSPRDQTFFFIHTYDWTTTYWLDCMAMQHLVTRKHFSYRRVIEKCTIHSVLLSISTRSWRSEAVISSTSGEDCRRNRLWCGNNKAATIEVGHCVRAVCERERRADEQNPIHILSVGCCSADNLLFTGGAAAIGWLVTSLVPTANDPRATSVRRLDD